MTYRLFYLCRLQSLDRVGVYNSDNFFEGRLPTSTFGASLTGIRPGALRNECPRDPPESCLANKYIRDSGFRGVTTTHSINWVLRRLQNHDRSCG